MAITVNPSVKTQPVTKTGSVKVPADGQNFNPVGVNQSPGAVGVPQRLPK